jgi:putative adenylate-forming enzyme
VSEEEQWRWVGTLLAKILPGPLYKEHRLALFLRANSNLYNSVEKGRIRFHFFDLFQSIEENAYRVHKYQPTTLVAPPSMLRFLAQYQKQGQIQLHPEKIISVAEVLDPLDEHLIQEAFHQKVHQLYQCTEGFLAATCSYGTLHVNEDLLVMEKYYLDKEHKKFSPIITDFTRTSQPIIRYLLNDILTEKTTPCPCGSPFLAIEQIEGRCDDIFYFQKKDSPELQPLFPDFIRRAILSGDERIEEYLVIQHDPKHMEIQLKMPKEALEEGKRAVFSSIQSLLERQSCVTPRISWRPYTRQGGAVKLRRVERRFSCPEVVEHGRDSYISC